jgi:type IV fimbrial biogenesis protein FimT
VAGSTWDGGWTLVELVVALAIGASLVTLAIPSYHAWIGDQKLMNQARALATGMSVARSEAIKSGFRVNLCKSADLRTCATRGSWRDGFLIYVDENRDGTVDAGEPVLRVEGPAEDGIRVSANAPIDDYVSYTSLGQARMLSGALQMGTMRVCLPGRSELQVVLANSGRVRIQKTSVVCP